MAPLTRLCLLAAAFAAALPLAAGGARIGLQGGAAVPLGGSRDWVGSALGYYVDATATVPLASGDALRVRLGTFAFQASRGDRQDLVAPGQPPEAFPATSRNRLAGVSLGAEYLHWTGPEVYLLGGAGGVWLTASRAGTLDLGGGAPAGFSFSTAQLRPYLCAGVGLRLSAGMALEARVQVSALQSRSRGVDLSQAGFSGPAQAAFGGFTAPTLTLGLTFNF